MLEQFNILVSVSSWFSEFVSAKN